MSVQLLLSVLPGGMAGFALGLVGSGGSILATPLLLYVVGVGSPHLAIGTSATAVSVAALFNFGTHAPGTYADEAPRSSPSSASAPRWPDRSSARPSTDTSCWSSSACSLWSWVC